MVTAAAVATEHDDGGGVLIKIKIKKTR